MRECVLGRFNRAPNGQIAHWAVPSDVPTYSHFSDFSPSGRTDLAQASPEDRTVSSTFASGYLSMKESKARHAGKSKVTLKPRIQIKHVNLGKDGNSYTLHVPIVHLGDKAS